MASAQRFFRTLKLDDGWVRSRRFKSAVVFPRVSTKIADEAMPIEDLSPFTGKFNRQQTSRSTKFSDAPESMRTCTGESFNVPDTMADPKLDGAQARKVSAQTGQAQ